MTQNAKSRADYIKLYQEIHKKEINYGISGSNYYEEVCLVIDTINPKTVLDYGCGKAVLITQLQKKYPNIKFYGYDPAIPERSVMPVEKADLVLNTDVLEHIPQEQLPAVIERISQISSRVFFRVHHALAYTLLPNGENAHCTVKPVFWYYHLFEKYFPNLTVLEGRASYFTTFLTFPVKPSFITRYEQLIDKQRELSPKFAKMEEKLIALEKVFNKELGLEKSYKTYSFFGIKILVPKKR